MPLAVLCALPEEQQALLADLLPARREVVGGRTLHHGRLAGVEVVLVLSGIGKVAAAATITLLLQHCGARAVLFTGVAGGLGPQVQVGHVVVGDHFLQHDMESAAVAQVCADFGRPLAVVRSISDRADDEAHVDFPRFLAEVAAPLAHAVVMAALPALAAPVAR